MIYINLSFKPGTKEVMALQADYIDDDLNDFLGEIIDTYASIPWTMDIAVRRIPFCCSICFKWCYFFFDFAVWVRML